MKASFTLRQVQRAECPRRLLPRTVELNSAPHPRPRWLNKKWNALRFVTMILLVYVVFDDGCFSRAGMDLFHGNSSMASIPNATLDVTGNGTVTRILRPESRYPVALVSLFLWMGVFQVRLMSSAPLSFSLPE